MTVKPADRKPIIYDTDMGSDDWLAALLLLSHLSIDVKAITVTGAGLAHVGPGVTHALGLVALAGKDRIEVAGGRETPLSGDNAFPGPWREASDDRDGLELPAGGTASTRSAVAAIRAHARQANGKLTVVATGPLTNLAEALREDAALRDRLEAVYVMGGAVRVPGNVHATWPSLTNETAEWNFYVDPVAAAEVIGSGVPVTLVPLDATDQVPVTPDFLDRLRDRRTTTPAAEFVFRVLEQRRDEIECGAYFFWDALAAAVAIDESVSPPGEMSVRVVKAGEDAGRTVEDGAGTKIRVCRGAKREAFERMFLEAIAPAV